MVVRTTLAVSFGVVLTFLVFFALPFMEIVAGLGQKKLNVRTVEVAQPPPPPPVMEEPPPPEEPPPEEKPPEAAPEQNLSLSDLELAMNPGGIGDGSAGAISDALANAAQSAADQLFQGAGSDKKPRATAQPQPKYPAALKRQKLEGVVVVSFVVDANGRVLNPRVEQAAHPAFGREAMEAVKNWRFEPGERGGKKVPMKVRQSIRFSPGA